MADNVAKLPSLSIAPVDLPPMAAAIAEPVSSPTANDQPRLAIEQGPGGFVYKVLDRVTGEVIRQLPYDSLSKLGDDPSYGAGQVIKTSA